MAKKTFAKVSWASVFALTFLAATTVSASSNRLVIGSGSGWPGTKGNVVTVALRNEVPVRGFQLELADMPDYLRPDSVWVASRAWGFIAQFNDVDGVLHLLAIGFSFTVDPDSGAVVHVSYRVAPEAPVGAAVELRVRQAKVIDGQSQLIEVTTQGGVFVVGAPSGIQEDTDLPVSFALLPNYPNPLAPGGGGFGGTVIAFSLPQSERVSLIVYDLLGRKVRTLLHGPVGAGWSRVCWDGNDDAGTPVPAGVYLYRLQTPDKVATRRLSVVR